MKRILILCVFCLAVVGPVCAGNFGGDLNGNGLWDDFDRVVSAFPAPNNQSVYDLAKAMQSFTTVQQNKSLALQSMAESQRALLCVFGVYGNDGKKIATELRQRIKSNTDRATSFANNEQLILGEELPFEPEPENWIANCSFVPQI